MIGTKNNIGTEGFVWFIGVVEDRMDPEQLNRVRVRAYNWHTDDKELIPTEALPWASCIVPPTNPAAYSPKEGDWVVGFFLDAHNAQHPVIMGVIPGKPQGKPNFNLGFSDPNQIYPKRTNEQTTNRLARERADGTVIETRRRNLKKGIQNIGSIKWDEPDPKFEPKYPYNYAHESESGHAFELDDTEGKERVHLAHKNGNYIEMDYEGNRAEKIIKDNYSVIMGSDFVYVEGNCNISVKGDCNVKVCGKLNVEAAEINMTAQGDFKMRSGGKFKIESASSLDIKSSGAAKIGSGGKMNIKGKTTTVKGSRVSLSGKIKNKVKVPRCGIGKILTAGNAASPTNSGLKRPSCGAGTAPRRRGR